MIIPVSRFILSECCHREVMQDYEGEAWLYPVVCLGCGREAGTPGGEDIPPDHRERYGQ